MYEWIEVHHGGYSDYGQTRRIVVVRVLASNSACCAIALFFRLPRTAHSNFVGLGVEYDENEHQ